jgi:hypothetical protein
VITSAPVTTITYSSFTVTVPQVKFTTSTVEGNSPTVGLIPAETPNGTSPVNTGLPASVHASSTLVVSSRPSTVATPTPTSVYSLASTVSFSSSLLLASIVALFGLML